MQTLVNIKIGNNKSDIVTSNEHSTNVLEGTHNANITHCIHEYVCVGNVVTIETAKRGSKAAETYFAAIRGLESTFIVKADIIGKSYVAVLLAPKLKVA